MAFFKKASSILGSSLGNSISKVFLSQNPSIYQGVRCKSRSSKVFVGGLPDTIDESELREVISRYGQIIDSRLSMNRKSGRCKKFAFVSYPSCAAACAAIEALDRQKLHGLRIRVQFANDRTRADGQ